MEGGRQAAGMRERERASRIGAEEETIQGDRENLLEERRQRGSGYALYPEAKNKAAKGLT